jgi:hypothetical protein
MRYLMSAHAETTRIGARLHARRRDLPARRAVRCPLVSAREVAPRTKRRSLVARVRGTSDQIGAGSVAHPGLRRAGVVQRDWLRYPDLPVARSEQGCAPGKPILRAVGRQTAGGGRPPRLADVDPPGGSLGAATPALWVGELARLRRGPDGHSPPEGTTSRPGLAVMSVED